MLLAASFGWSSASVAEGLDEIPADVRANVYNPDLTDSMQPLAASVYRDWKSPNKPPWTVGYASTYAGNTWRKGAMKRLLGEILPKWQKLGLIKDIIITQSNLKDSLQIQQMRQLVDQGVDVIIICCSNPTALNLETGVGEPPAARKSPTRGRPPRSGTQRIDTPRWARLSHG